MEDNSLLQDYMTPAQCAAELGVCSRTLERWDRLREGPPKTKLGRRVLYHRESVSQWLADQQIERDAE